MAHEQSELITVKRIPGKGRGVFARCDIKKDTEIERVPVLVIPERDIYSEAGDGMLSEYVFAWGKKTVGLALGYGSLYNHSYKPNARYEDDGQRTKAYIAIRKIAAGEEITINYNGDPNSKAALWFDVVD